MADRYENCTQVTPECPSEATIYGYYPNLGANIFFLAFFAAGIYLTLKHLILTFGEEYSRLRARWYTWIFIGCDLLSLILQGAGGGTAATADTYDTQKIGNDLMMTGIAWQVFTLLVFAILAGDYAWRSYSHRANHTTAAARIAHGLRFKAFIAGLFFAWLTIFVRCVYRIAEMANGWKNSIMQDETDFIVLEGVMIVIATGCLTVFHPGFCFKPMQMHKKVAPNGLADEKDMTTPESELSPVPQHRV
ncbi:MAG: hypothetical protein LQ351_006157 [Letrouitia transgressa]|nr:MAG: hypothetical protein LQ351_006157 [Letrouitia transgressa]